MTNETDNSAIRTQAFQTKISVEEYVASCVDEDKFMEYCKQCSNYKAKWSCPPLGFCANELLHSYKDLLLYGKKLILPAELTESVFSHQRLKEQYTAIITPVKEAMLYELLALEKSNPESLALSAGSCEGCTRCARSDNKTCKRPEYMRHSIESLGGDVGKSIKLYFGETLMWAEGGRLPGHFFLLGGLLMR